MEPVTSLLQLSSGSLSALESVCVGFWVAANQPKPSRCVGLWLVNSGNTEFPPSLSESLLRSSICWKWASVDRRSRLPGSVGTSALQKNLQAGFQQSRAVFWTILTHLNCNYFWALIINACEHLLGILLFSVCPRVKSSLMKLEKDFNLFFFCI